MTRTALVALLACAAAGTPVVRARTPESRPMQDPAAASLTDLQRRVAPAVARALSFQARSQAEDGGWPGPMEASDPAITALVARTFIQHPAFGPGHVISRRAIDLVLRFRQPDGGIYDPRLGYLNYTSSLALMALAATGLPAHRERIIELRDFLLANQWVEGKTDDRGNPVDPAHPWYGGAGYGEHKRPDLSNTHMMLEALRAGGLPPDHPGFRKALRFVSRCQMLGTSNDQPFARAAADGGFIYSPANGGESKAGTTTSPEGDRLRSYGSMTYAGFMSMIYADVSRDDPRVVAAWDWIRGNYTLKHNPNMPGRQSIQGLYYFYHVFAKALNAWGEPFVVEPGGARHDWREDLCAELLARQRPDGSWVNDADRWMEGNPHLVTAYSVLALQIATGQARP